MSTGGVPVPSIWRCPVCSAELGQVGRTLVCSARHSFDLARSGYVNLLLPQQKGSKDPGDTAEMVHSRTQFLKHGHYQALSDLLNQLALGLGRREYVLLDAGCGEGYFLRRLAAALREQLPVDSIACFGVDISKAAAKQASQQSPGMQIAVASTFHLPVLSASTDLVLKVMAPGDPIEIRRVLRSGGHYLAVVPGPFHLQGLKQLIYQQTGPNDVDKAELSGFELLSEQTVRRDLHLTTSDEISHLLAMTPYYWNVDAAARQRVAACNDLHTPMQFAVRLYRK